MSTFESRGWAVEDQLLAVTGEHHLLYRGQDSERHFVTNYPDGSQHVIHDDGSAEVSYFLGPMVSVDTEGNLHHVTLAGDELTFPAGSETSDVIDPKIQDRLQRVSALRGSNPLLKFILAEVLESV